MIAIAARREGLRTFAAGTGPTAIANTILEVGHSTYRYVGGEMDTASCSSHQRCSPTALRGAAAFYCGLAGQVLVPVPVAGAIAGCIVGYVTAAVLVQSGLLGVGPRNIVAQEAARRSEVEGMCRQAVRRMGEYRALAESVMRDNAAEYQTQLLPALDRFELALFGSDPDAAIEQLALLNGTLGEALPFRDIAEFDDFMEDPDAKLLL